MAKERITIRNEDTNSSFETTRDAFEKVYKHRGWVEDAGTPSEQADEAPETATGSDEVESDLLDLSDDPTDD